MSSARSKIAGCLAIAAVLTAGCAQEIAGKPFGAAAPSASTSDVPSAPRPVTTPSGSSTNKPTRKPKPRPVVPISCTVDDLSITLGAGEGTAGTFYRALAFTNTGRRTCVIGGFPGVSFVAGDDGHQVGAPAVRDGANSAAIRLAPGDTAAAALGFADLGAYDPARCKPTPVRGLRVYPPHNTRAAFLPLATKACAGDPPSPHLRVMSVQRVPD